MLDPAGELLVAPADGRRFLLRRPHVAHIILAATVAVVLRPRQLLELADRQICALEGRSALKHLAAAAAVRCLVLMLCRRTTGGTPDGVRSRDVGPRWRPQ